MPLSSNQKKYLRGLGHSLHPVVIVGDKGLNENVRAEIEQALAHHELIKIKLRSDREQRARWQEEILALTGAELVDRIGQVICLYRRHPEKPVLRLPARNRAS